MQAEIDFLFSYFARFFFGGGVGGGGGGEPAARDCFRATSDVACVADGPRTRQNHLYTLRFGANASLK